MMIRSQYTRRRASGATRTLVQSGLAAACLLAGSAAAAMAQDLSALRPGAAQTTSNQVTLAWDAGSAMKGYYTAPAQPAPSGESMEACVLDYRRADNMWAGQPSASLGTETITLAVGQKLTFITDWRYEKLRNDGTHFYGSHLRVATNRSSRTVRMELRGWVGNIFDFRYTVYPVAIGPNNGGLFSADLVSVTCQ